MLENFFWQKNANDSIVKEKILSVDQRKNIVNTVVDFIIEAFGNEPTTVQKIITAQAAIVLCPGLEFREGESTVRIFLTTDYQINHVQSETFMGQHFSPFQKQEMIMGWINRRISYVKSCQRIANTGEQIENAARYI